MQMLTKEVVGKLTPEQQEALANLELRRLRDREQLLQRTPQDCFWACVDLADCMGFPELTYNRKNPI